VCLQRLDDEADRIGWSRRARLLRTEGDSAEDGEQGDGCSHAWFYLEPLASSSVPLTCVVPVKSGLPLPSRMKLAMAMVGKFFAGAPVTLTRSPGLSDSRVQPRRIKVTGLGNSKLQFTVSPLSLTTST